MLAKLWLILAWQQSKFHLSSNLKATYTEWTVERLSRLGLLDLDFVEVLKKNCVLITICNANRHDAIECMF